MLPARSPPVRGQQWTLQPASPPSTLPVQHTPSRDRRPFTSNPGIALTGEGDIPTSSHSFLLLWKIKVKSLQRPATAASAKDLLLLCLEKRGKRRHRAEEMFLELPTIYE